jgi:predicted membrane channel-forming protein YqfA (hemolysin III family)
MSKTHPKRGRRFQYTLTTLLVVVSIAAIALRTLEFVPLVTVAGIGVIVAVFGATYWLVGDSQRRFYRPYEAPPWGGPS